MHKHMPSDVLMHEVYNQDKSYSHAVLHAGRQAVSFTVVTVLCPYQVQCEVLTLHRKRPGLSDTSTGKACGPDESW